MTPIFFCGYYFRILNRTVVLPEPTKPVRQYKGISACVIIFLLYFNRVYFVLLTSQYFLAKTNIKKHL